MVPGQHSRGCRGENAPGSAGTCNSGAPQEERAPCPYWAATPQTLPGPGRPCREQSPGPAGTRLPRRVAGLVSRPEGSAWRGHVLTGSQTHKPRTDRGDWRALISSRQSEEAVPWETAGPNGQHLAGSWWYPSGSSPGDGMLAWGGHGASLLRDRGTRKLPPQGRPPCCLPVARISPPPPSRGPASWLPGQQPLGMVPASVP